MAKTKTKTKTKIEETFIVEDQQESAVEELVDETVVMDERAEAVEDEMGGIEGEEQETTVEEQPVLQAEAEIQPESEVTISTGSKLEEPIVVQEEEIQPEVVEEGISASIEEEQESEEERQVLESEPTSSSSEVIEPEAEMVAVTEAEIQSEPASDEARVGESIEGEELKREAE